MTDRLHILRLPYLGLGQLTTAAVREFARLLFSLQEKGVTLLLDIWDKRAVELAPEPGELRPVIDCECGPVLERNSIR